jgi:Protein of unknown function (DUF2934)
MARKATTKSSITNRSKRTASPVQPAAQVGAETVKSVGKSAGKNGGTAGFVPSNFEEEIRRRAYELYLERRATAGAANGDENQDWLIAEQEILSHHGGRGQHSA